jgi:hypothetical protein
VPPYNPRTQEVETGYPEFEASLGCIERHCLKTIKTTTKTKIATYDKLWYTHIHTYQIKETFYYKMRCFYLSIRRNVAN